MPKVSRADIDAAIEAMEAASLAGDADRLDAPLDRLWSARMAAANAIVERVSRNESRAPGMMMETLTALAGARAPTLLRRIARSPDAPDVVRFGAQRRAG